MRRHSVLKQVILTFVIILIIVAIAGLIGQSITGTWDVREWFGTNTEDEVPADDENEELPVLGEDGEELTGEQTYAMPKAMTFRTAASLMSSNVSTQSAAYDSITLTATVYPTQAVDKTVDWSIAWVNASSSWANGKTVTDYVTVTPSSDGSTTATVQCLQPFGEQIKITVTSRNNTNATASCTVDFAKRITNISIKLGTGGSNPSSTNTYTANAGGTITVDYLTRITNNLFSYGIEYSAYTVNDTLVPVSAERRLNSNVYNALCTKFSGLSQTSDLQLSMVGTQSVVVESAYFLTNYGASFFNVAANQQSIIDALSDLNGAAHETFHIAFEGTYSSYSCDIGICFDPTFSYIVESITLNDSSVII